MPERSNPSAVMRVLKQVVEIHSLRVTSNLARTNSSPDNCPSKDEAKIDDATFFKS